VPPQIPAGNVARAWKERVDAGLHFRWIEDEYSLAIFLQHGVVARHRHLFKRLAILRGAVAKYSVIHSIGKCRQAQRARESNHDQSLEEKLDSGSQQLGHDVQLYAGPVAVARLSVSSAISNVYEVDNRMTRSTKYS
jgi:hypothetical protein